MIRTALRKRPSTRKKSDTRMHPAIARAMKWGAIQNLYASLVRRALSSIVSCDQRDIENWNSGLCG
jgi:hypothetical protein